MLCGAARGHARTPSEFNNSLVNMDENAVPIFFLRATPSRARLGSQWTQPLEARRRPPAISSTQTVLGT
ncbi:hypothetical protein EON66_05160 [archaeon]|nr:MAG: hypothetical protein EON66_05160 [archaeon]